MQAAAPVPVSAALPSAPVPDSRFQSPEPVLLTAGQLGGSASRAALEDLRSVPHSLHSGMDLRSVPHSLQPGMALPSLPEDLAVKDPLGLSAGSLSMASSGGLVAWSKNLRPDDISPQATLVNFLMPA